MATIVICDKCGKHLQTNKIFGNFDGRIVKIQNYFGFGNEYYLCDKCAKEVEDFIKNRKE